MHVVRGNVPVQSIGCGHCVSRIDAVVCRGLYTSAIVPNTSTPWFVHGHYAGQEGGYAYDESSNVLRDGDGDVIPCRPRTPNKSPPRATDAVPNNNNINNSGSHVSDGDVPLVGAKSEQSSTKQSGGAGMTAGEKKKKDKQKQKTGVQKSQEFQVEHIVRQWHDTKGGLWYYVKWKNWSGQSGLH